ncbi:diguanylate cyclase [Alteromonadaceae bacterium M269]|nr:diguanylate cyclase [Alteromonadaceae bacterium M269]
MTEDERASVLIVDDEPINISLLAEFLSKDYQILFSTSGAEAIELVRTKRPDLVLLDIGLPDIDGYEVCKQLKANQMTQNVPIVFSTAKDSTEDEVVGLNIGASDYITKPYNMELIKARVKNQIRLKKKTDLLEQLASLDGLTELPNRRYFDEHFEYEWRRSIRSNIPISIAMVDVDYFKYYNDHYGHSVGDECLQAVAKELSKTANRGTEFVARYGGEEFVFVWPEVNFEEAMKASEVVRSSIEALNIPHEKSPIGTVSVSIGVGSTQPSRVSNRRNLIEHADELLYKAKLQGRNRVFGAQLN